MTRGRMLLLLVASACGLVAPATAGARLRFRDCRGVPCARLAVPLDRGKPARGRISLYVERRPAARRPRRGITLLLAGGPGQAATAAYAGFPRRESYSDFAALTPRNDIVVFDQRGTGHSGLLRCPELEHASLVDAGAEAAACARRLGPRRGYYRTTDTIDDIEALRVALGARRVTLVGVSYGTLVAQAYAARHPDRVERVLLDSILGVSGWDPFYRDVFHAVPRVVRAVCGAACRRFTRDPVTDVGQLVERLGQGPLHGRVVLPNGRRRPSALTRPELFFTLGAGDLDDISRSAFPAAVSSALHGDAAPILRLKRRAVVSESTGSPRELSAGLYAATTCEEIPFPWPRFSDLATRYDAIWAAALQIPPAELYPFDAATTAGNDFIRMCRRWPEASPGPYEAPAEPLAPVPILMLSGELDLRTPLEGARADAAAWPASRLLEIPNTGHSVLTADLSGCAARAARRFLRGRSGPTSCRRGRNPFPATPPLPASLRALRPIGGVAGDRGRVIRALELTLYDVAEDYLVALLSARSDTVRGAGLRGGRWSWASGRPLRLERVELVPGVRVSGRVRRFGTARQSARLRISGTPRASGRLVLRGGRVSGRLGGRRASADIFLSLIGAAGAGAGGAVGAGADGAVGAGADGAAGAGADGAAGAGADGAAGAGADGRMPLPELLRAGRELASRARAR